MSNQIYFTFGILTCFWLLILTLFILTQFFFKVEDKSKVESLCQDEPNGKVMNKELYVIKGPFSISIYSEHRNNLTFKHFLTIKCLGVIVFHCFWRTGKTDDGSFYIKDYEYSKKDRQVLDHLDPKYPIE